MASTIISDPELKVASSIFQKEEPSSMEELEDGSVVLYPTSEEEFHEMLERFGV